MIILKTLFSLILSSATIITTSHGEKLPLKSIAPASSNTSNYLLWPTPPFNSNLGPNQYIRVKEVWPHHTSLVLQNQILAGIRTMASRVNSEGLPTSMLQQYHDTSGLVDFSFTVRAEDVPMRRQVVADILDLVHGLQLAYGAASMSAEVYEVETVCASFHLFISLGQER